MPKTPSFTRSDIIVTVCGVLLLVAAHIGVVFGTGAYDDSNPAMFAGANAFASISFASLAGLIGYYEQTWRLWRFARSVGFLLLSGLFALGSVVPAATEWLFAVLVEVL